MSDIIKTISFIDTDADTGPAAIPPEPVSPADRDTPVLRSGGDPTQPKIKPSAQPFSEPVYRPAPAAAAAANRGDQPSRVLIWIGIGLAILTALAIGAASYGYFQRGAPGTSLSPWAWAGLVMAVIVPATSVLVACLALRALQGVNARADHLARVADRLSRADETVPGEIASMAAAIRGEIAGVDAKLARTRSEFEGFGANLSQQSRDMDDTTKTMAERSEVIGRALALHRQAFESLANTFDAQMESLASQIDLQRGRLSETTTQAEADLGAAKTALETGAAALSQTVEQASGSSRAAEATLSDAEERLSAMIARIQDSASELDSVYERRSAHLASLTDRLSGERDGTEAALHAQAERLSAVDAQIEITEARLTALVDHAEAIQSKLQSQLAQIDATLDGADERTRRFTESLGERVSDSVADTRRDLSLMEADLRALQARLKTAETDGLALDVPIQERRQDVRRVHLKPLETDFPPVEPPRDAAPAIPLPLEDASPLDLVEAVDAPAVELPETAFELDNADTLVDPIPDLPPDTPAISVARDDVIRRPGEGVAATSKAKRGFGKTGQDKSERGGWHWRDMLGGIDPLDTPAPAPAPAAPVVQTVVRPPAGTPLTLPPAAPSLPDGSDVVARLCEVKLAPSAVVDEGTIIDAGRSRLTGGQKPMVDVVLARLRDPVVHLRGVLAADLEFRLRAEAFCRSFDAQLAPTREEAAMRASLGSASGRAFLLCSAALHG